MLAWGAYSPLRDFQGHDDYVAVVDRMRTSSGALWPIPIAISVPDPLVPTLKSAAEVELQDQARRTVAVLRNLDLYRVDSAHEARSVYGTDDVAHPGVARVMAAGEWRLGGRIDDVDVDLLRLAPPFHELPSSPQEVGRAIADRGWKTIVAFQTRNPIHRAHEYLTKVALEGMDGLLIHPLVGETKSDDVPAAVRLRCYEVLIDRYYPKERVLLALFPAPMRYAGPREAVFHALVRANYGATHFIVGRDHAGVGSYYGPTAAQRLLLDLGAGMLGITPVPFENAFYCTECGQMATGKSCPHPPTSRVELSGTRLREQLASGIMPPAEYSRREVGELLVEAYRMARPDAASQVAVAVRP